MMDKKAQDALAHIFNMPPGSGLARIGQAMGAPIKAKLDYAGLARRMMFGDPEVGQSIWRPAIKVDRIKMGELPIYDQDV